MTIIRSRPLTPSQRYTALNRQNVAKKRPERSLTRGGTTRSDGRNCYGRITSRRRGGGHKRLLRFVDFKRDKFDILAKVQHIEYDPNRSAQIALVAYADGEKRYILAPEGLKVGDSVQSLNTMPRDFATGMSLPLSLVPLSIPIHCVELLPGRGAQLARTAGSSVQLLAVESGKATLRLMSGEVRYVDARCRATLGSVGNAEHNQQSLGKAGRRRWMGRRPRVRGVAMNPVDHPMGGGEGRTSGGGHPVSPWGQLAKGFLTRKRSKPSNSSILIRRNGRKVKRG
ncbi:MAG: 50S ribosomal protein L2 [Puniceicoccales bacterium]|jgi:large subunit ribosomal protein L2|nr:50S ribosomal protein L2 [Puniceicoccales bacterium]